MPRPLAVGRLLFFLRGTSSSSSAESLSESRVRFPPEAAGLPLFGVWKMFSWLAGFMVGEHLSSNGVDRRLGVVFMLIGHKAVGGPARRISCGLRGISVRGVEAKPGCPGGTRFTSLRRSGSARLIGADVT